MTFRKNTVTDLSILIELQKIPKTFDKKNEKF